MELTKIHIWTGGGLTALLVSMAALAQSGCSSDDSSTATDGGSDSSLADASVDVGPPPPLGVPLATCSVANCPVCGGVLGSVDSGITFCTQDCDASTDCPTGLACVPNQSSSFLNNLCLRTCTSNSDCTAPFICRSDLTTPGSYCYTPYPPPGTTTPGDSGTPDAGSGTSDAAADTGTSPPEAGPPDAGSPSDASVDAADGG